MITSTRDCWNVLDDSFLLAAIARFGPKGYGKGGPNISTLISLRIQSSRDRHTRTYQSYHGQSQGYPYTCLCIAGFFLWGSCIILYDTPLQSNMSRVSFPSPAEVICYFYIRPAAPHYCNQQHNSSKRPLLKKRTHSQKTKNHG